MSLSTVERGNLLHYFLYVLVVRVHTRTYKKYMLQINRQIHIVHVILRDPYIRKRDRW